MSYHVTNTECIYLSENSGATAGLLSRHFPGQPALAPVAQMSLNPPSYLLLHIVSREFCEQSTHIKDKLWADKVSLQKDVVAPQAQQQLTTKSAWEKRDTTLGHNICTSCKDGCGFRTVSLAAAWCAERIPAILVLTKH